MAAGGFTKPSAHLANRVGVRPVGPHGFRLQRLEQLPHEQRIAGGRLMARRTERLLGVGSQPSRPRTSSATAVSVSALGRTETATGSSASRRAAGSRTAAQTCAQPPRRGRVQAFQPALEVRDETQRRLIAPMQVVDQQQQRSVSGDVRSDPEQAVENAEGHVGRAVAVLGRVEHPCRRLRGTGRPSRGVGGIDQEGDRTALLIGLEPNVRRCAAVALPLRCVTTGRGSSEATRHRPWSG
jgi:hypothetical protein